VTEPERQRELISGRLRSFFRRFSWDLAMGVL
jgi:hypothetical protein